MKNLFKSACKSEMEIEMERIRHRVEQQQTLAMGNFTPGTFIPVDDNEIKARHDMRIAQAQAIKAQHSLTSITSTAASSLTAAHIEEVKAKMRSGLTTPPEPKLWIEKSWIKASGSIVDPQKTPLQEIIDSEVNKLNG